MYNSLNRSNEISCNDTTIDFMDKHTKLKCFNSYFPTTYFVDTKEWILQIVDYYN